MGKKDWITKLVPIRGSENYPEGCGDLPTSGNLRFLKVWISGV